MITHTWTDYHLLNEDVSIHGEFVKEVEHEEEVFEEELHNLGDQVDLEALILAGSTGDMEDHVVLGKRGGHFYKQTFCRESKKRKAQKKMRRYCN